MSEDPRSARRHVFEAFVAAVLFAACIMVGQAATASVVEPTHTSATMSLTLVTPTGTLGPFSTAQPAPAAGDTNGVLHVAPTGLSFAPVNATLSGLNMSVSLVPTSDVVVSVDPGAGTATLNGNFTLGFTGARPDVCTAGPFSVEATTQATGGAPYSPSTGNATVVAAAPSVPAVAPDCGGTATAVNAALSLPLAPPPAAPTTSSPGPPTAPVPRIEVQLNLSPPLHVASTTTTRPSTTTVGTPTDPAAPAPGNGVVARPASTGPAVSREHHSSTKDKTTRDKHSTTTTTNALANLKFNNVSGLPLGTTPLATPPARSNNDSSLAFAPASSEQPDSPSAPGLVLIVLLGTIGVAVALWLIKSDLRSLVPAAGRRDYTGRIARPTHAVTTRRTAPPRRD